MSQHDFDQDCFVSHRGCGADVGERPVALSTTPASARVVCNAEGDCWHTDAAAPVVPGITFSAHPDDWYFHQHWDADHRFRDYHDGRGYYKGGVWITL